MLLVVYNHVEYLSMNISPTTSGLHSLVVLFHMPLFFFASGFVAFKINDAWDFKSYNAKMLKKLRILIIPMLFFGLLYATTLHAMKHNLTSFESVADFFNHDMKLGYWFTESLLMMS